MRARHLAFLVFVNACASAPLAPGDHTSAIEADRTVLRGCYECLLNARASYERLATGKTRHSMLPRLFEVNVLIALRERELAIDGEDAFDRARQLIPELPQEYGAVRYLAIAEAIPPDFQGTPRIELARFRERATLRADTVPAVVEELQAGQASPAFRAYLVASIGCARALFSGRAPDAEARTIPPGTSPLVRYRIGTCPAPSPSILDEVVMEVPSFVEAGLFAARRATFAVTATYISTLRQWLSRAGQQFPRSPSVTYGLGALSQTTGDCAAAVRHYEDTLALKEAHEDAALGRVICLSYTGRSDDAIDAATRMIERRTYNLQEAWYWKAWNRHRRKELDLARSDIDTTRRLLANAKVYTLAGVIEYDQGDFAPAERDLEEAIRLDAEQCVARWYRSLVAFMKERWPDAAERFGQAAACYERSVQDNERRRAELDRPDLDPAFRASQMAGFDAVIKEDRDQQHASMLNAANGFARAHRIDDALRWLDRIPPDATLAGTARELRQVLEPR